LSLPGIVLLVVSPAFGQQPKEITNSIGMKLVLVHPGSFTTQPIHAHDGRTNGMHTKHVDVYESLIIVRHSDGSRQVVPLEYVTDLKSND
jgi:hypothetical protein